MKFCCVQFRRFFRLTQNDQPTARAPGRVALGGGAAFRGNLWSAIENLTVTINAQLAQVAGLEAVMAKRKDTISHATFLQIYNGRCISREVAKSLTAHQFLVHSVPSADRDRATHSARQMELNHSISDNGKQGLVESLWDDLSAMLSQELISASTQSTFVRQAFEGEYPKLIKIFTTKLEG